MAHELPAASVVSEEHLDAPSRSIRPLRTGKRKTLRRLAEKQVGELEMEDGPTISPSLVESRYQLDLQLQQKVSVVWAVGVFQWKIRLK